MTITFLMDNAELTNERFTLKVVEDPVVTGHMNTVIFPTQFPCKKDLIDIEVEYFFNVDVNNCLESAVRVFEAFQISYFFGIFKKICNMVLIFEYE